MNTPSDEDFDGPNCGFQGWCAREVGHIGDHHADPGDPIGTVAEYAYRAALHGELPVDPERIVVGGRRDPNP